MRCYLFPSVCSPCLTGNSAFLLPKVLSLPRSPAYTSCLAIDRSAFYYTNHSNAHSHSVGMDIPQQEWFNLLIYEDSSKLPRQYVYFTQKKQLSYKIYTDRIAFWITKITLYWTKNNNNKKDDTASLHDLIWLCLFLQSVFYSLPVWCSYLDYLG